MNNLQKIGGIAALYLAAAYLVGIVLFLFVLDYPNIVDPAQKVALLVDKQTVIYSTNLPDAIRDFRRLSDCAGVGAL